jgi:WD40 repeat protein
LIGHTRHILSVAFSPDGRQIVSGGTELLLCELLSDVLTAIEEGLTLEQARLLYQMYCAAQSDIAMILKKNTIEYEIYETLPDKVKREICRIFPVRLEKCIVKEQQESGTCCIL